MHLAEEQAELGQLTSQVLQFIVVLQKRASGDLKVCLKFLSPVECMNEDLYLRENSQEKSFFWHDYEEVMTFWIRIKYFH